MGSQAGLQSGLPLFPQRVSPTNGIAGGVSANSRLRADAEARGAAAGLPVFVPPLALSTDNAAMIGAAGLRRYRTGMTDDWEFNAEASLPLTP